MTSLISLVFLWNVTRGILTLLATIQRRLTVLRSLYISQRAELRAVQKFLETNNGYHVRSESQEVQDDLLNQYNDDNTGF
ncbi:MULTISPECIES: hypothetical protein [unclassified Microcoleus]|uniref:hypothetical protein n=1 Tax=unclassified Microcoleus TaxID=2642155 RepID=UPI002FD06956